MTSRATDFSQQTHEQSSTRYSVVARVVPRFLSSIWLSAKPKNAIKSHHHPFSIFHSIVFCVLLFLVQKISVQFLPKKRERFFPTKIYYSASLTTPPLDPHRKKDLYHRASTEHSQRQQQPFDDDDDDARAYIIRFRSARRRKEGDLFPKGLSRIL